ncbi:uncharacterized protein LOC126893418 isoform X4 [Diabrotica virgifera virgifera]|uniref:Uncharacterized protein n=1 Tax=Diabrotica virgifera virgifera TaxID=50390 RepID=A0ABM5LAS7_DIAVI|nr:uncharacterized protein LOC126893418 isoform X4 [Diabrotica virgifera virgifera]XP_050519542.1 uncharacterized protein LOC126893418 isoform X4 [Diabrotica virgifera virgifera]
MSPISGLKKQLSQESILIHCDLSENYNLKYAQDTLSFHFGGSRQQINLHTVVVYKTTADSIVKPKSYCTMSECLKHDVPAIWAHLLPVLKDSYATMVHFLSDSPATQYRNKCMFNFLVKNLNRHFSQIKMVTWNYCEAGHGKGPPDGIGGVCKRTADRIVPQGSDIDSLRTLIDVLEKNCSKIKFYIITEQEINKIRQQVEQNDNLIFKGTMKVHQVVSKFSSKCWFLTLSCFTCEETCHHYGLGCLKYKDFGSENIPCTSKTSKLRYEDVYSDSEEEDGVVMSSKIKPCCHILVEVKIDAKKNVSNEKYKYMPKRDG